MRKAECKMEGSAAQRIDQGMPAQCTGRQVSPRVESCVRWQYSTPDCGDTRARCSQRGHEIGPTDCTKPFLTHTKRVLTFCVCV